MWGLEIVQELRRTTGQGAGLDLNTITTVNVSVHVCVQVQHPERLHNMTQHQSQMTSAAPRCGTN